MWPNQLVSQHSLVEANNCICKEYGEVIAEEQCEWPSGLRKKGDEVKDFCLALL